MLSAHSQSHESSPFEQTPKMLLVKVLCVLAGVLAACGHPAVESAAENQILDESTKAHKPYWPTFSSALHLDSQPEAEGKKPDPELLKGDFCALPAPPGRKLSALQKRLRENPDSRPEKDWHWYPVKILSICDTLQKAREKAERKEKNPNSNLDSSEPGTPVVIGKKPRKRKRVDRKIVPSSSSDLSSEEDSRSNLQEPSSNLHVSTVTVSPEDTEDSGLVEQETADPLHVNLPEENNYQAAENSEFEGVEASAGDEVRGVDIQQVDLVTCVLTSQYQVQELVSAFKVVAKDIQLVREDVQRILAGTKDHISDLRSKIPPYPATDENQFRHLEAFEDKTVFVRYLSCIAKGTVQHVTYAILERLLSNRLADRINWTGANNNLAFEKSPVCDILKCSVQNSFEETEKPPEDLIRSTIVNWFRTSKGRK